MIKIFRKTVAVVCLLVLMVSLLCSCGGKEETKVDSSNTSVPLIIEVDGKTITVEDTEGQSIDQILKDIKFKLNDSDIITVDTSKNLSEGIVIRILRKFSVTIKNSIDGTEQNIVLVGGTVKDALDSAGVKLADNHTTNYKLTDPLEDDMEIVISIKEEPKTTQAYVPEEDSDDDSDSDYRPDYNSNSNHNSNSGNNSNNNSNNSDSGSSVTKAPATTKAPAPTKAPETTKAPAPTKPATTSGRTIVSVDIYEDCDGSGHGVKVITYSDGTQEEVAF